MKTYILSLSALILFISCTQSVQSQNSDTKLEEFMSAADYTGKKVHKTDDEWKKELNDQQYYILRKKGTESRFSSELYGNTEKGIYVCAACGLPLFKSGTKFKAKCGWPSFYAPYIKENIAYQIDNSHGMHRIEVLCPRCGGHIGHVFKDGPPPTGLRYCINGDALEFKATEQN